MKNRIKIGKKYNKTLPQLLREMLRFRIFLENKYKKDIEEIIFMLGKDNE